MSGWTNPNVQQVTPLVQLGSQTGIPSGPTVPAAGFLNLIFQQDVSLFASYDINFNCVAVSPGAAGSALVGQINLVWFDDMTSGIPVFEEDWFFWVGRSTITSGNPLGGTGPMHGRFMSVTMFLPPTTVNGMSIQYLNLFGSNRVVPYSDWRQNCQLVQPESSGTSLLAGSGTSFDNVLCETNAALTAGSLQFLPCGLYAGPAYYQVQMTQTPAQSLTLVNLSGYISGGIIFGAPVVGQLVSNGAAAEFSGEVILPRGPCAWMIHANATTGGNANIITVAQQAA